MQISSADAVLESTSSWSLWYRGIHAAPFRARYTIARAKRYFDYVERTSARRHVVVVAGMPLPGLLAALVAPCITMQPPSAGVLKNTGLCLHFLVTIGFTMTGAMIQTRAVTSTDHKQYSLVNIVIAAAIGTAHLLGLSTLLGYYWRFPVPFSYGILFVPWMVFLMWGNIITLRSSLLNFPSFRNRLLLYMPSLTVPLSQVAIYPAYSAVFQASGQWGQYALIALFPFLKMTLKRSIYATSHHLTEFAKETSVSGVEIWASMYQSNIMQSTPSASATALVIGLDVCQSLFELKMLQVLRGQCRYPEQSKRHPASTRASRR